MTWTDPKTWSIGEALTAALMNIQLRDNLNALKDAPEDNYIINEASDYTTASNSFVDVDATNLKLTITTTGGDILIGFFGFFYHTTLNATINLEVTRDGVAIAGDDGLTGQRFSSANARENIAFNYLLTGVTAGTYEFRLQWKTTAGNVSLSAGAGSSGGRDVHSQFFIHEH